MKIGRNDPCPCGSGKKYKKCRLQKDQEASHIGPPVKNPQGTSDGPGPDLPKPPPPQSRDPYLEAINARWEEFEKYRTYEGQIALFLKSLDEEGLMDDEMAFEMLNAIYYKAIDHGERDRFDALEDRLRERLPDVYAHEAHYCLEWRIENALAAGRLDALPALVNEMAAIAAQGIDLFNHVLDQLAYYGHLSVLLETMRIAWPQVKDSKAVVPWGIDKFAMRAVDYVVFDYVERHSSLDVCDQELIQQIEFYYQMDPVGLSRYLAHLTGQVKRHWTMNDFDLKPHHCKSRGALDDWDDEDDANKPSDIGGQNLLDLSVEFLGYLRREEGVPTLMSEGPHRFGCPEWRCGGAAFGWLAVPLSLGSKGCRKCA